MVDFLKLIILMVYLFNNQVTLAATPQVDAFGRLRVGQPMTLFDSQQRFGLDKSFTSNVASEIGRAHV